MRQDPEAIMIGEIRIRTASIAVQAGADRAMVISTIHSDRRLASRPVDQHEHRAVFVGIQYRRGAWPRLLRTICEHCKVETQPNAEQLGLLPEEFVIDHILYRAGM